MRILFDQGTPAPLRRELSEHVVTTAYEMGWANLSNGDLLREAELQFDLFLTTDQSLGYQQNLVGRHLTILVLPTTSWPLIRQHAMEIKSTVNSMKPGQFLVLQF
jgi:hypothetical protein